MTGVEIMGLCFFFLAFWTVFGFLLASILKTGGDY